MDTYELNHHETEKLSATNGFELPSLAQHAPLTDLYWKEKGRLIKTPILGLACS